MVLSGYHIPAGTHVDLNPSVHFNDPEIFPEPHRSEAKHLFAHTMMIRLTALNYIDICQSAGSEKEVGRVQTSILIF